MIFFPHQCFSYIITYIHILLKISAIHYTVLLK